VDPSTLIQPSTVVVIGSRRVGVRRRRWRWLLPLRVASRLTGVHLGLVEVRGGGGGAAELIVGGGGVRVLVRGGSMVVEVVVVGGDATRTEARQRSRVSTRARVPQQRGGGALVELREGEGEVGERRGGGGIRWERSEGAFECGWVAAADQVMDRVFVDGRRLSGRVSPGVRAARRRRRRRSSVDERVEEAQVEEEEEDEAPREGEGRLHGREYPERVRSSPE
jgi:hypothetical protein